MATLINLRKVQHGTLTWHNGKGSVRTQAPLLPTANGVSFDPESSFTSNETMIAAAQRLSVLDTWTPHATFEFASNHRKTYTGPEALRLWEAWKGVVYQS